MEFSEKRKILKGINLEIAKGKCIVLMGENGIGKTTSIRIICGLLSQNQGKISSKGKISYLPEVSSIYPYLIARESIDLFSNFGNVMYDTDLLLDMLKLPKDSKTLSKDNSKRTKRKTSMGIVMSTGSDLFVMDEHTMNPYIISVTMLLHFSFLTMLIFQIIGPN